ncbi:hypothetical protein ACTFIW_012131, partial [Dictyostelium discoideum]
NNLLD